MSSKFPFINPHHSLVTSILLSCQNQISLTTQIPDLSLTLSPSPDFSLTLAKFLDISMFPEIPEKCFFIPDKTVTPNVKSH